MKPVDRNEFLAAIQEFGKAPAKRPAGEGWYTLAEYAAMSKKSIPAIKYGMWRAEAQGVKFERAFGTMPNKQGVARKAVFFRIAKNGKR